MILVTGGTGLIGGEVVRLLSQASVPARALVRDPHSGQKLPGITWVIGDLTQPETLPSVFAGCTKLFLLTGNSENAAGLQRKCHRRSPPDGCHSGGEAFRLRRFAPFDFYDRSHALSDRDRAAGVGVAVDDAAAAPFHAEPPGPG